MDFALSAAAQDACDRMWDFMRECVLPAEPVYDQWRAAHGEHDHPPVMEDLKTRPGGADYGTCSCRRCPA